MTKIKCVAFDLDGTLLNDKKLVSKEDYNTLIDLEKNKTVRIAATGRNLFSVNRLFHSDFPMDYVVFSSGAGIIEWKTKNILRNLSIDNQQIKEIVNALKTLRLDYLIKEPIPNSHSMHYSIESEINNDLYNYTQFYKPSCKPLKTLSEIDYATQIIALIGDNIKLFKHLKNKLPSVKTILTTSPINQESFWLEFFNKEVSKSGGIELICKKEKIHNNEVICVGNDYNDMDMLDYFSNSYVVSNAPKELLNRYIPVVSNNENGFTEAVNNHSY